MFRSWRQSVRELGERVERLEGELGRLNMENADLKSQLKERDARIAKLESVLEGSRRAGKRQAAPFSKDKPKRDPKKPGRKPGSKYGRQAVRATQFPTRPSRLRARSSARAEVRTVAKIISHSWMDATCSSTSAGKRIF